MRVFDVLREKLDQTYGDIVTGYYVRAAEFKSKMLEIIDRTEQEFIPKTNADMIRSLTDEQLAEVYPCPYDTAGFNIMPCILDDNVKGMPDEVYCRKCMLDWLKKEVKE